MSPALSTLGGRRSSQPVRVAVAGLGFGETVHLPALRSGLLTEPVALWHPRAERLEQACHRAELPGHTDFDALLGDPQIEAVVIATPPGPRFDLARRALLAGKHLLLEKPVALEAAQIEELQRLALRQRCCVAVDFEYRAVPLFQQMAALIAEGVLGDPWLVKLDWLMSSRADGQRPWTWYSQVEQGGGVLGALGTHAFDTLHWLVGPTRSLRAQLSTAITERPLPGPGEGRAAVDAEDIALLQMVLGTASGVRTPAQVTLASVTRQGRGYWIELYGSEATLVLGSSNQSDYVHGFQLWMARPGEALRPLPADPSLAFARTWEDGRVAPVQRIQQWWAEAIREGRPMLPGLAEAVASQRCCDWARQGTSGEASLALDP
ncbi:MULTISPECIES: Gfo/Idh/MocA family protein [unclassified Synechococcus]|uniref:Gfo/Idh/MocA family protein n=1 Tax=unclassified Synechococcus TaxID=2626047 RepID=UPI0018CEE797|nr:MULTISPECIES: Gfo/Idh/MocA family oxidoreductase [unclassified Synechococcus]QPN66486.1 Gfo/Idh/MocA family oxidoreductase [Synechococcus sp. CBW1006]CAK6693702.1 Inositol 2-dehydrogenase/D-chiro-inositol 3-dehydrogenase [Synechococcus sp. CBW1107]